MALSTRINVRLAKLQGALDAIEAVKTGVEQNSRMAEKTALKFFASIRAAVDSREKEVLKVPYFYINICRAHTTRAHTFHFQKSYVGIFNWSLLPATCWKGSSVGRHPLTDYVCTQPVSILCRICEPIERSKRKTWITNWKSWKKRWTRTR